MGEEINKGNGINFLNWLSYLLIPVGIIVLLRLAEILPYLGGFFELFNPVATFFVFIFTGIYLIDKSNGDNPQQSKTILVYLLVISTLMFCVPYIVGYYTYPTKIVQKAKDNNSQIPVEEASAYLHEALKKEVGNDGIISYAIYMERLQVTKASLGEYVREEFKEANDLEEMFSALINTILHIIPMLIKWVLCTELNLVSEPGYIGIVFWYLFSLILSFGSRLFV